ncbi:hypothetical protein RHGRI_016809 [Rhododendron griersonianum]|uniref:Endonuclease/exonuclease/phosphatase domain-containing protein n=1 Tax=Rhododendron griersonianum TaxID=479676 RepID=A0AAV6JVJ5_9ERIC|nr:hypothetical protein RHGRI_016809 [Rhododendron griersonianum]
MKIKIISWNVRGLNARDKRVIVKVLLKGWRADVVCLQETKLKEATTEVVKEIWGSWWVDWIHLNAVGASAGGGGGGGGGGVVG